MNWLQILMIIAGLMAFTMIVCSGIAMQGGREGLSQATRRILIAVLLCCVVFFSLAGEACEDEVSLETHYPTYGGWNRR